MYKKLPQVKKYIEERLDGKNKMESALLAGYSEETSKKPSLIESTQRYAVKVQEILHNNVDNMSIIMQEYKETLQKKPIDLQKAYLLSQIAEKQTRIHDILTPKVTVKEVQNKDGTTTRTMWGSNSAIAKPSEE